MSLLLRPDPGDDERPALEAALRGLAREVRAIPMPYASAWRQAALRENAAAGLDGGPAQDARRDAGIVEP